MTATCAPTTGLRVLVADDDALNLRVAARLLRELGHGGAMVNGGQRALSALAQQRFDLVLLDIHMPDLDGYQTLCAIRERDRPGQRQPVVMMSGDGGADTQAHFARAGADAFLIKPLSVEALTEGLRRWWPG
ncbi:response regulator [Aquabacterium sp. A08]|uniref:response regulator n=1 Tax=Aquabacterium sp. A08 TaxID=2718532 RepID=UPI0014230F2E|nr:response regulator [Aquabacterium sp. A08]NIC42887.1 response regulator [Aquabacterium sp. A08]